MKRLHRKDLFAYSVFDERLNIDFNSFVWVREGGNVVVDPLPMTAHDTKHLRELGGAAWIVVTNSDHVRGAQAVAKEFGARVAGPRGEKEAFPLACDLWLGEGDEVAPGLVARVLDGSKTKGELALVLQGSTLVFGDLVRAHRAGALMLLLPEQKLRDKAVALASIRRLAESAEEVTAVLLGDGWCAFGSEAKRLLHALVGEPDAEGRTPDDSGEFRVPSDYSSIPPPRAGAHCSVCGVAAEKEKLVSGTASPKKNTAAVCAPCASKLAPRSAAAPCDFCLQPADETARAKELTICRACVELALAIFADGEA